MTTTETTRNEQNLREHMLDYVAYVLTSTVGLYREPHIYGPMRMVDALEKSLNLMKELGFEDADVAASLAVIRENRWLAGTDAKGFSQSLEEAIIRFVRVTKDNSNCKIDAAAENILNN